MAVAELEVRSPSDPKFEGSNPTAAAATAPTATVAGSAATPAAVALAAAAAGLKWQKQVRLTITGR